MSKSVEGRPAGPVDGIRAVLERYFRPDQRHPATRFMGVLLTVGSVLSIGTLIGIVVEVGWHHLWLAFTHAQWVYMIMVPVAVAVSHLGYTVAYQEVVRSEECRDLGWREALHIVMTGFGPLSPKGGYAVDAKELVRRGMDPDNAARTVRGLGLLEYAVLAPAALAAAVYMAVAGMRAQAGLLPSWIVGVPVGSAVAIALLVRFRRRSCPERWWAPLRRQMEAIDGLLDLLGSWRRAPLAVTGMVVYWLAEIAALGGCIEVFAHRRAAVAAIIVGYATGYALTRRSLPLAGAGVVEALMPFALSWVGFPLASSVLAVIAYRIFNMWLAMIPAVFSLHHLERLEARKAMAKDRPLSRSVTA